jgi:hypothetical protein
MSLVTSSKQEARHRSLPSRRRRRVGNEPVKRSSKQARRRCIPLVGVVAMMIGIFYFFIRLHNFTGVQMNLSSSFTNIQQKKIDGPGTAAVGSSATSTNFLAPQQQQEWWDRYVQDIARPFSAWKGEKYSWCLLKPDPSTNAGNNHDDDEEEEDDNLGLVFVKNPKAASSTGAGINMRIARHVAVAKKKLTAAAAAQNITSDTTNADSCAQLSKHGILFRKKKHSLLWTNVRDPAKRSVSQFFHFQVSRRGKHATMEYIPHLREQKGFQVNYLRTGKHKKEHNQYANTTLQFVHIIKKEIFKAFDFIALVERMDESLVVMKLLFDLEARDMIVLSAKTSGGYDDGQSQKKCFFIQKAFTTPEVDEYLADEFKVDNADYLLYAAANRSLDLTIDALGRKRVEEHVRQHRVLQKLAEEHCLAQAVFPCSANGTRQTKLSALDCYQGDDSGCGYRCVDRIIQEYTLRKE